MQQHNKKDTLDIAYRRLTESFENRRFSKGAVKFSNHKLSDPHIKKIVAAIAKKTGSSVKEVEDRISTKIAEFSDIAAKAPILYGTIVQNIAEDTTFSLLEEHKVEIKGAPRFSKSVFLKLVRLIKADHDQFFPMRSFLNHKRLHDPVIYLIPEPKHPELTEQIKTAAASPKGEFYFNIDFMQRLMDFAHVKGLKPKGKKYVSNGGDIPDEYGWIEFVILHEFMHYTYDDFHYQKIIPNANPTIINWVGDFRTNYLLVKSGYEQLPMGLFNDEINYDRQKTYVEMYKLVEEEFKKLNKDQQKKVKSELDGKGDQHGKGQAEGESMAEGEDSKGKTDDIDKKHKQTEEQMEKSGDNDKSEPKEDAKGDGQGDGSSGGRGARNGDNISGIDYTKIKPKFNWRELIKLFISSASQETEETYFKPSRRSISGIHTARQLGAGAMKPGEMPIDLKSAKLGFVIDSSGSMSGVIETVYSNIDNLLKSNAPLQACQFTLVRFSAGHHIYKGIFKGDKAAQVKGIMDTPTNFDKKLSTVFKEHYGSATNFTSELSSDLATLLKNKYNILIFSDSDITSGENLKELMSLFKIPGGKIFIVFDTRATYLKFRQNAKFANIYTTYFAEND